MNTYVFGGRSVGKTFMAKNKSFYTRAQKEYQKGTPIMSDEEFDVLEMQVLGTIGSAGDMKLPVKMWSTLKDQSNKLIEQVQGKVIAQHKVDGVALQLNYLYGNLLAAYTRGDGVMGQYVAHHLYPQLETIPLSIPHTGSVIVIGEAYITKDAAKGFGYKNARNGTAGILNHKEAAPQSSMLKFFAFDIVYKDMVDGVNPADFPTEGHKLRVLKDFGFTIVPTYSSFDKALESLEDRDALPYLVDGIVIKVLSTRAQQVLGYTDKAPKFYSAYKFEAETDLATLEKIEWSVGRTGQIIPLAHFTAVDIGGSTIKKASLHSYAMVEKTNIAVGDKLKIVKAGDIIPQVDRIVERCGGETQLVSTCPSCGSAIQIVGEHAKCLQPRCKEKVVAQITYATKTMGLKGLGPAKAKNLYEQYRDDPYIAASVIQEAIDKGMVTLPESILQEKVIQAFNTEGLGQAGAKQAVAEGLDLRNFVHINLAEKLHLMLNIV